MRVAAAAGRVARGEGRLAERGAVRSLGALSESESRRSGCTTRRQDRPAACSLPSYRHPTFSHILPNMQSETAALAEPFREPAASFEGR
jgi:hypothetical protein